MPADDGLRRILNFDVTSVPYDVDYTPHAGTRATTNFANLARDPATRRDNIARFLSLVNADLNRLLDGDPHSGRFEIALEILSVTASIEGRPDAIGIPLTEVMKARVVDTLTGEVLDGPLGLNFSSYVRDYDFRVLLPELLARGAPQDEMDQFGALHGLIARMQFGDNGVLPDTLTVAISISQNCDYAATEFSHPILGREYVAATESITDRYFRHMGLIPQFFRPRDLPAPLAFYSDGRLVDRSDVFLAALVAVMANFQRIYRPEIYLRRVSLSDIPGEWSRASLSDQDHDLPPIGYDRQEREVLAEQQARELETLLIGPHADVVAQLRSAAGLRV